MNKKQKEYRAANAERLNAQRREYREANAEQLNAQQREYWRANSDRLNAQRRASYANYAMMFPDVHNLRLAQRRKRYHDFMTDDTRERLAQYKRQLRARSRVNPIG